MDADCFDAISRSLSAAVSSRRRLLTGVAGGTLGTLLGLHGLKEVAAARQQTASCEAPNGFIAGDGEARYAQSFIPALGGKLSRVRVTIQKTRERPAPTSSRSSTSWGASPILTRPTRWPLPGSATARCALA